MSKTGHTARHDDAKTLGALEGLHHRDALLRLDGRCGAEEAARTRQLVDMVRDAVQSRRSAVGETAGTRKSLFEAVRAGYESTLADDEFPVVASSDEPWLLLVGMHITAARHNSGYTQYLTGVVIGVSWEKSEPQLRVAPTRPEPTRRRGQTVSTSALHWMWTPSPAQVAATASRDNRCRAGRPLYTSTQNLERILATVRNSP